MIAAGVRLDGRYQIVAGIGAGGMGEVYRAHDLRLQRDVAIKVLPELLTHDRDALARFEREARTLATLSHPNILAIHDFGTDGGIAFAVTELLEGETLRQRMLRSRLPWQKALELGDQIAEGLAAAHSRGIVHRDLKPENLFLTADGSLKILDFGLARASTTAPTTPSTGEEPSGRTDTGVVMGTAPYMSPEQLRGQTADARSDIFSLGCVLYELLAARPPFRRATPVDTMSAVLNDDPAPLPDLAPPLPPAFQLAIFRSLEKTPEARFQSARDLAFALRMISGASGILGPAVAEARSQARRRRRWLELALPGVALLLLSVAAWRLWGPGGGDRVRSIAVLPFANASADPDLDYLSDGIAESVINSLSQLPQLRVMARSTVFRYKGRDLEPRAIGRELKVEALLAGRVVQRGGTLALEAELVDVASGTQLWGERFDGRLADLLTVQQRFAGEITEKLRLALTREQKTRLARPGTADADAYRLYLRGRYHWNKRTEEGFHRSVELFQQAIDRDPSYALAYVGLADAWALTAAYGVAPPAESMPRAKAAAKKALEIDPGLGEAHACLALVLFLYDWDFAEAGREFRRALELTPGYATTHHWYAEYLMASGRFQEAIAQMERAEEMDPLSLILTADKGRAYYFARDQPRAIDECRKALRTDPGFVPARVNLAMALEEAGRFDEAIAELQEAARISGDPRQRALLGPIYARSGRRAEAEKLLAEVRSLSQRSYVAPYHVACIYAALGDKDQAFAWLERAASERSAWMAYLKVSPRLDVLHQDPRFPALLRRSGL